MRRRRLVIAVVLTAVFGITVLVLVVRYAGMPSSEGLDDPATLIAREYIAAKENWQASAYTVENTQKLDSEGNVIVNVVHKDDLDRGYCVGGGKSLELHVDLRKRQVAKVLHFQ
jgi:hypothetical protein